MIKRGNNSKNATAISKGQKLRNRYSVLENKIKRGWESGEERIR